MNNLKFDWKKIQQVLVTIAAALGLLLGIVNYVQGALPAGEVQALGVSNFDDIELSGGLTAAGNITAAAFSPTFSSAANITASTSISDGGSLDVAGASGLIGSVTIGGGFGNTGCTLSGAGVLQCNGAATIGGAATITGALTVHNATEINGNLDADSFSTAGNMDITTMNNTGANPVTVNDNLVVTGTLSVNGATFTGPIKYGTAASYNKGASITHGFATTPTMCILQPTRDVTSTLTITATGFSSDMATVAEPIYWMCGQ